jgi:HEAT repeat protein
MDNHATKATLLLTLVLLGSCATGGAAPEALEQLTADSHESRIEAIRQLGKSRDPHASEALLAVIGEPRDDAAEREQTWFEAAGALEQLAEKGMVGEEALPALDRLAAQKSGSSSSGDGDSGALDQAPRVPYDRAAADAARTLRLNGTRSAGNGNDGAAGRTKVQFLAELAWIQRIDEGDSVHQDALEKLKKTGAKGVAPSAELIDRVRPQSGADMVAYFVEMHSETGDETCVRALLSLAASPHEEVWRPALTALRETGDTTAGEELIERLEAAGVPDTERTQLTLSAVGGIGSEESIPFLVDLLDHESADVARSASDALVDIGDESAPFLMDELSNIDRQIRLMSALALSRLGNRQGHEAARRFLNTARGEEETVDEIRRNLRKR